MCSQGQLSAKVVTDLLDNRLHLSGGDLKNRLLL